MLFQLTPIKLDGIFEAQVERVADEGVADGDFFQTRDVLCEVSEVLEIQVVTGI